MKNDTDNIIRNHIFVSMGVGLIPLPIVDVVVLMGVQLNMLRKLSKIYNIPFSKDKGKYFIASLMGSSIPVSLSGSAASLVKAIPIIGQTTGALTMFVLAARLLMLSEKSLHSILSPAEHFLTLTLKQ